MNGYLDLMPDFLSWGSDLETAGLPCPDMSFAGKRQQENGKTVGAFLTHAKRHVELQTPIIAVENTKAPSKFKNAIIVVAKG